MRIDNDHFVIRALSVVATDIEPRPDLGALARRGGRRRLLRRRIATVGGVAALALTGLAGGLYAVAPSPQAPPGLPAAADQLMAQDTQGDLAGDREYLARVLAAHRDAPVPSPANYSRRLVDEPHVAWAGRTPAGSAAAVVQDVRAEGDENAARDAGTLIRFFGTGPGGRPEIVSWNILRNPDDRPPFALLGAARTVLVVLEPAAPAEYSLRRTYTDTTITRTDWKPLRFDAGAAVIEVPSQRTSGALAVRHRGGSFLDGGVDWPDQAGPSRPLNWHDDPTESYPASRSAFFPLGGPDPAATADDASGTCSGATGRLAEEPGIRTDVGHDWLAAGRTAAGDLVVACDLEIGLDPPRSVALVRDSQGGTAMAIGPQVDPAARLPVAIRLPAGNGWIVAKKDASLRYRVGEGEWINAGRHAALLPAEATAVLVNQKEVPLPG